MKIQPNEYSGDRQLRMPGQNIGAEVTAQACKTRASLDVPLNGRQVPQPYPFYALLNESAGHPHDEVDEMPSV